MDTSEKYFKMCGKAVEIQENHKLGQYDNYYGQDDYMGQNDKSNFHTYDKCDDGYYSVTPPDNSNPIWLPRQDQLQEMLVKYEEMSICSTGGMVESMFENFWLEFLYWEGYQTPKWATNIDSMEQLWLGYVMQKIYKKIWAKDIDEDIDENIDEDISDWKSI